MATINEISRRVQLLPDPLRVDVLRYIDFLLHRSTDREERLEDFAWFDASMRTAMRGLEDETGTEYSEADLIERYS